MHFMCEIWLFSLNLAHNITTLPTLSITHHTSAPLGLVTLKGAHNLNSPATQSPSYFLPPSFNLPYSPSLTVNTWRKPRLSFSSASESLLPGIAASFGSTKFLQKFSTGLDVLRQHAQRKEWRETPSRILNWGN